MSVGSLPGHLAGQLMLQTSGVISFFQVIQLNTVYTPTLGMMFTALLIIG